MCILRMQLNLTQLPVCSFLVFVGCFHIQESLSLPPLGLTLVDSLNEPLPFDAISVDLSVIDGMAYISVPTGVWQTDSNGHSNFTSVTHSVFGQSTGLLGLTQIVKGPDDNLYLAGSFDTQNGSEVGGLFRFQDQNFEIVTWPTATYVVGVDRNLRTLGYDRNGFSAEYHVDGSVVPLGVPPGCQPGVCESSQFVTAVAESGYAIGEMAIPGTIGTGPGIWGPDGSAMVIEAGLGGGGIADRVDGSGINYAYRADAGDYRFRLGTLEVVLTLDSNANELVGGGIGVTQSDFTFISSTVAPGRFAYYPGIVPGSPEVAVPLDEVIPELASVSGRITDSYVVGNRIYMSIYDDGDLYLFGALDPSQVPEPSSICCAAILLGMVVFRRR